MTDTTKQTVMPEDAHQDWRPLFRLATVTAVTTLALIPIQLATFVVWPLPGQESAADWFRFLQENRIAGLISLDILLVVDWLLLLPMYLAFFACLRRVNPSAMTLALGLWFLAAAAFIASNPALGMSSLSDRHAEANETERAALEAAGEALLASGYGTAFHVSYVIGQLAGIIVGLVMVRSAYFGRLEAWLLVGGNALGFGLYLPKIGLMVSAASGLVLWAWYVLVARSLWRLGWKSPPATA